MPVSSFGGMPPVRSQGLINSRNNLAARNARVFNTMGREPGDYVGGSRLGNGQVADLVSANAQQTSRNWMPPSGRQQLAAPIAGGGFNGRSVYGDQPTGAFPRPQIDNDSDRLFVPNIHGGRPRFFENMGGQNGYLNSAGQQTIVNRTASGGLSFTGQAQPENQQLVDSLRSRAESTHDDRVLGNARKYGLDASVPAVRNALQRTGQRNAPLQQQQADDAAHRQRIDAIRAAEMDHHMKVAGAMKDPVQAAKYLQGVRTQLEQERQAALNQPARKPIRQQPQQNQGGGLNGKDQAIAAHKAAWDAFYKKNPLDARGRRWGVDRPIVYPSLDQWPAK